MQQNTPTMSYQTVEQQTYTYSTKFTSWFNNIFDNDEIEILEKGIFYNTSLGHYIAKKHADNNTVEFTRMIPFYERLGFIYNNKNKIDIHSHNYDSYSYVKIRKTSFYQWYDDIDETKIYALEDITNWPFETKPVQGNYQANKSNREFMTDDGKTKKIKYVHFHRRIAIGNMWHDDPLNHIYVNETGDVNEDVVPYTKYNYTIKDIKIVEEEESKMPTPKPSGWF